MKETTVRTRKLADPPRPPDIRSPRPFLALLVALFFASGCAALIYEIVWYQLLQLVIGSSAVSLGVLLATFMGGLCIGSLALPRILSRDIHPLRVYAAIELGIGICGLLALFGMPLVDRVYAAAVGHGLPAMLLRAVVASACLLPPTILMGASLPAAARWIETGEKGVSWLGLLYGANTCGAVFGCLLAGFYLLRVYDMAAATFVAATINAAVALTSYALSKRSQATITEAPSAMKSSKADWPVYITIALSGASALGAEIVWTRLLGLLLGATVYTFSIILAVFLIGIGIGSNAGSLLSRHVKEARIALGWCQMLIAGAIAWTALTLAQSLPYWPINPLLSTSPWYTFQVDLVRCLWAILPAACLWGASFPLALRAVARVAEDPGRMIGGVYAANTAGAILGALGFNLILIPHIGSRDSQRVLIALAALSGLIVAAPVLWQRKQKPAVLAFATSVIAAIWLVTSVSPVPGELIAYGRRILTSSGRSRILYVGEGMNSSIAISQWDDGAVQFHVSGKVEASTEPYDMRLQRMLGFMPALFHPHPASVLVVGFGAGVTAGSFTRHPEVRRIVICEMEPLVPPIATRFFARENYDVLKDRRTEMIYDDARHYILTSPDRFDIITSDPIHPWVKGSATLYSKEYFELVKRHLNPGGIVTQWVPLYESDTNTVKSEIATFFEVFPRGTVWGNENAGGGYDVVLLGQAEGQKIDVPGLEQRLAAADYIGVRRALGEVGFHTPMNLLATYAGSAEHLKPWLSGAEMNRDGNLRLQYLAGMALNVSREATIYDQILRFRRYPEGLFDIPEDRRPRLKISLGLP
jgi:spermidine synthase